MLDYTEHIDYLSLLEAIKTRIHNAQYEAMKAVNKAHILLNWDIGRMILEKQEQLGWGKSVVTQMSKDIQFAFPGIAGYSPDNLWRMRKFYLKYKDDAKLAPLVQEISWSHNIYTVGTELPDKWKKLLPSPAQLEKHFALIEALDNNKNLP